MQIRSLGPLQVGVGVPAATEAVAMGAQSFILANGGNTNWVMLQVDMTNAFNSLDRPAMLQTAKRLVLSVYNYLAYAYGRHAPLYIV